jgi:hypothetical protein
MRHIVYHIRGFAAKGLAWGALPGTGPKAIGEAVPWRCYSVAIALFSHLAWAKLRAIVAFFCGFLGFKIE